MKIIRQKKMHVICKVVPLLLCVVCGVKFIIYLRVAEFHAALTATSRTTFERPICE